MSKLSLVRISIRDLNTLVRLSIRDLSPRQKSLARRSGVGLVVRCASSEPRSTIEVAMYFGLPHDGPRCAYEGVIRHRSPLSPSARNLHLSDPLQRDR